MDTWPCTILWSASSKCRKKKNTLETLEFLIRKNIIQLFLLGRHSQTNILSLRWFLIAWDPAYKLDPVSITWVIILGYANWQLRPKRTIPVSRIYPITPVQSAETKLAIFGFGLLSVWHSCAFTSSPRRPFMLTTFIFLCIIKEAGTAKELGVPRGTIRADRKL